MYANGWAVPTLLLLVVGLRLECITVDPLHAVDQGIASHIIANVLWYFTVIKRVLGGSTQQDAVKRLDKRIRDGYKEVKCASKLQGELTLERLRASAAVFPMLKAKAAQTRHLARFALAFAQKYADMESKLDRTILCIITLLVRFYELLHENSQFLGASARDEMPQVGRILAEQYSKMSSWAHGMRLKMWRMTPKLHMFENLTEMQCLIWGNPQFWWTYSDEDLVGYMIEVAESCHPSTQAVSIIFKWLHLIFDEENMQE